MAERDVDPQIGGWLTDFSVGKIWTRKIEKLNFNSSSEMPERFYGWKLTTTRLCVKSHIHNNYSKNREFNQNQPLQFEKSRGSASTLSLFGLSVRGIHFCSLITL